MRPARQNAWSARPFWTMDPVRAFPMDRFISGFTLAAALYVWAAIACAGIDVTAGPLRVHTLKLLNPGMLLLVLVGVRAVRGRHREAASEPEEQPAADPAGDRQARWML